MQQLWAQVLALWQGGEQHWLTPGEMQAVNENNEDHAVIDPIEELVRSKFAWRNSDAEQIWLTATDIAAKIGFERPKLAEVMAVSRAVKKLNGGAFRRSGSARLLQVPDASQGAWDN
jgi:putative DNA primase/helicase